MIIDEQLLPTPSPTTTMTRADGLFIKTFVFVFSVSLAVFVSVCLCLSLSVSVSLSSCWFSESRSTHIWQSHSGHCMAIPRAETYRDGNHTAAIVWQYHEQKHTEMAITQRPLYGNTTSRNTLRRQSHKQWFEFVAFIFHIFPYPIFYVKCICRILIYVCT